MNMELYNEIIDYSKENLGGYEIIVGESHDERFFNIIVLKTYEHIYSIEGYVEINDLKEITRIIINSK